MTRTVTGRVTTLADVKRLPADWLRNELGLHDLAGGGIGIPYHGPAGELLFTRERDRPDGKRFHQPAGVATQPYGLWRLDAARRAGFLYIVEGESDAWTLWHHKLPALGLPGSSSARCLTTECVETIEAIFVVREPGQGGATFVKGVAGRLSELGFAGRASELRMPNELKDPSDLHLADPDQFLDKMQAAVEAATLIAANNGRKNGRAGPAPSKAATQPTVNVNLTDRGNGLRLMSEHGKDLKFCHPWRKWLVWNGKRWRLDDSAEIMSRAKLTVAALYTEYQALIEQLKSQVGDPDKATRLAFVQKTLQWALKSEDARRLAAMLEMAKSENGIPILPDQLDCDAWLFNCSNGTVNLRSGELRSHQREDLLTKLCPTVFQHDADCPTWRSAINLVFNHDEDLIGFVQRFMGYCLTGSVKEQCLPFWYGLGANGKTTLLDAILHTMGADYAGPIPADLILAKRFQNHPTELASLCGKRLCVASETGDGERLAEARIKALTGGDHIMCRRMKEDFWTFEPTHKLICCTNHRPKVTGTDHAIWRRLTLVPFNQRFWNADKGEDGPPELRADKDLTAKLRAEAPGILAWMVQGCLHWQRDGLGVPAAVEEATAGYRGAEDTLGEFLADRCITGSDDYRQRLAELYAAFEVWVKAAGEKVELPRRQFAQELRARGFVDYTNAGLWFRGLALRNDETTK